jgi:hypothetical protein
MKSKLIKAKDFDRKFDQGEDISQYLDYSKARRINQGQKRAKVKHKSV